MKIAIFSDIHSNYPVFNKAYQDALNKKVDMFIYLGDYLTDGFDGDKVLKIIKNCNGYVINGNRELYLIDYQDKYNKYLQFRNLKYAHDHLDKDDLEYLKTLPIYKIIDILGYKICLTHATPYSIRDIVLPNSYDIFDKLITDYNCDIYLFGHTHEYFYKEYKNKIFINPGSIGLPTNGLPFKYGILNITENGINYERIDIDYDYKQLETYYKESDYYQENPIWCEILLLVIKTGMEHACYFLDFIKEKAEQENIDISEYIPDELYIRAYKEYISKL